MRSLRARLFVVALAALAVSQAPHLGLDLLGAPVEKQPRKYAARINIGRHRRAAARPGEPTFAQV